MIYSYSSLTGDVPVHKLMYSIWVTECFLSLIVITSPRYNQGHRGDMYLKFFSNMISLST